MSIIRWLTTFLLLADFVLINSVRLPVSRTDEAVDKTKQWTDAHVRDVNRIQSDRPDGGSDPLFAFNDSGPSIEAKKNPTLFSHQVANSHPRREDEGMSSRRTDHLIVALSKIAKVRSFEEDPDSIKRNLTAILYNAARNKSVYLRNGISAEDTGASTFFHTKLSSRLSSNGIFDDALIISNGIGRETFHCRVIRDVYISKIKENVSSYACISGNKTFILSSKRFFQDRRSTLLVNIDDDTLRKLNDPTVILANGRFNVIPAILILKPGHENYDIRNQQSVILREQQMVDDKNSE